MKPYKPVACDFVDQVEIAALRKTKGRIRYLDGDTEVEIEDQVVDWQTKNKEEFLVTANGLKIRLDQVIQLFDQTGPAENGASC